MWSLETNLVNKRKLIFYFIFYKIIPHPINQESSNDCFKYIYDFIYLDKLLILIWPLQESIFNLTIIYSSTFLLCECG